MEKRYTDKQIKIWHCEECHKDVTKEKNFKTTDISDIYLHRKVYCEKCWNKG